jgi:hypothetical protein
MVDPDDKRAWQLVGKVVPAAEIQCLTLEGWVTLDRLDLGMAPVHVEQ